METKKNDIFANVLLSFITIPMLCTAASGHYVQQTCIITIVTIVAYIVFSLSRVKKEWSRYYEKNGRQIRLSKENCVKVILLEIITFIACIFLSVLLIDLINRPYSIIIIVLIVILITLDGAMNFLKYASSKDEA